jgi:hypothetical protein
MDDIEKKERLARQLLKITKREAEGKIERDRSLDRAAEERKRRDFCIQAAAQWWYLDDERNASHPCSLAWCCAVLGVSRATLARALRQRWCTKRCLIGEEQRAALGPMSADIEEAWRASPRRADAAA